MSSQLKLFSGRANPDLSRKISNYLEIPLGSLEISNFSDGEISIHIHENVRGQDIFVIQPTCYPGNENLMELLILVDALKRASAKRITAVIPYYGYGRQDKKDKPRVPISAKLVADLITAAGTDRILTMDLHAGQIPGFFNIPVDHLFATPVIIEHIKKMELENLMIISPDAGGTERARAFAKRLDAPIGIIDKRRPDKNISEVMNVVGDVKGKEAVIIDDIIDTAGTVTQAASALVKNGARRVFVCCTHAVLSGPALDRLTTSPFEEVIVTDTIPLKGKDQICKKLNILSVASLLGEAINRIHTESSVSSLFV